MTTLTTAGATPHTQRPTRPNRRRSATRTTRRAASSSTPRRLSKSRSRSVSNPSSRTATPLGPRCAGISSTVLGMQMRRRLSWAVNISVNKFALDPRQFAAQSHCVLLLQNLLWVSGLAGPQMYKAAPCRVMSQLYHCLVTFHGTTTPLSAFVIVHKASNQRFSQEPSEALSCDLNPHRDLN